MTNEYKITTYFVCPIVVISTIFWYGEKVAQKSDSQRHKNEEGERRNGKENL